jgi:peptide/nickel transport system permease protein
MDEKQNRSQEKTQFQGFLDPIRATGMGIVNQLKIICGSAFGRIGLIGMVIFLVLAVFAPYLAPYPPYKETYHPNGELAFLEPPSWEHLFGTTLMAQDLLSQIIWGTRRTLVIGLTAAFCAAFVGTNIGLIAGYFGGKVDMVLMRMTDIAYGIPFIPFAMVAVMILGRGDMVLVLIISSILWRTTARVIRSQVLTLKERPFIAAAKTMGASSGRILYRHIMPNVIPLSFLYSLIIAGDAVLTEASLSFLGLGNPNTISWGQILFYCFSSQRMRIAWWWGFFPGISIVLLVLSAFFIGRSYEETINPRLREM